MYFSGFAFKFLKLGLCFFLFREYNFWYIERHVPGAQNLCPKHDRQGRKRHQEGKDKLLGQFWSLRQHEASKIHSQKIGSVWPLLDHFLISQTPKPKVYIFPFLTPMVGSVHAKLVNFFSAWFEKFKIEDFVMVLKNLPW